MPKSGLNVALKGLDDIFSTEESRQEEQREQVQQIPVSELFPFKKSGSSSIVNTSLFSFIITSDSVGCE